MVKTKIRHIALVILMLLIGGISNETWAVEVTYHILTKPFNVKKKDGTNKWTNDIRVEALRCTSTEATIGLPLEFKSPLATNFRYYRGVTCSHTNTMLYDNDGTNNKVQPLSVTYDIFEETDLTGATLLDLSSPVAAVDGEHIYVTYDYIGNDPAVNTMLLLNGSQNYNIQLSNNRFLCLNRSRNNRPGAANAAALTAEHLASDDFVVPPEGTGASQIGFKWSTASDAGLPGICLRFKFVGEDPYNVTIMTAYEGTATYTEKLAIEGTRYKKPYAGSTLFARMKGDGTTEKGWMSPDADRHYKSTTNEADFDSWQGFYRGDMNPIFNSVAVLPKGANDYMLVASKMNQNGTQYQPNSKGQYAFFSGSNANDPVLQFQTIDKIPVTVTYEIHQFTFKIKTPLSENPLTLTIDWSEDMKAERILDHIPEALKRKYVTFEGAYKEEGFVNTLKTFEDAEANENVIWLKYTSSMPFEALPAGGSYTDAHWYTIRMNGDHEDQYVVKYATDKFTTGGGSNSDIHQGENSAEAQVAFIGDPFELKIISRAASEEATTASGNPADASHNRYIGCAAGSNSENGTNLSTPNNGSTDINSWEIVSDATSGTMVLRQYGTYASPKYIGWHYGESGNPIYYKTESSRIKVVDLDKKNYVYHIVRSDGSIAVMASENQYVGNPLKYANIPEIIRSPFISSTWGSTLSFYSDAACTSAITHAAYDVTELTKHIYVKYTLPTVPSGSFNVRLNGQYIYYDSSEPTIKSADAPLNQNKYVWDLDFSDPYAMTVKNQEADKYVKIDGEAGNNVGLVWDATPTKFVVKSSTITGIYEVMVATGDGVDAATTYYNIGRPAANTVRIYSNASYQHGNAQLRFLLTPTSAVAVTYHLIDKSNKKLLDVTSRREDIFFPADYRSPLVDDDGYHYWATGSMDIGDTYTVKGGESEIANLSEVIDSKFNTPVDHNTDATAYTAADESHKKDANTYENMVTTAKTLAVGTYEFRVGTESYTYYTVEVTSIPDQQIYVTYDTNNSIDLQKGVMYLLEFEAGDNFRQEDGGDNLLADATPEEMAANTYRYKAVYPYCNGDCNFFVYGKEQYDIQQQGAASTRTRWAWYVESANNDPYHVEICSRQTETYNSDEKQAYFRTYVENYSGANHVVTGLTWPGISGIHGTEYMVLGSTGQYQLVTTEKVDVNNDGDIEDPEDDRQVVNSFEQYWKTFDTVRKKIYGHNISNNDIKVTDPNTVPDDVYYNYATPTAETLRHYLENTLGFHHYSQWAYAKRWNGFNKDGAKSKGWEEIEHWYQTVNMGEGYFNFVEINIDPVLILLDQHGWEIMRKPLPSDPNDPEKQAKYDAIRPYDSPMVKEYYFWSKTSKRSGFHQYHTLTDQTLDGKPYTSSSLTALPPYDKADKIKDMKGNLLDQYVTYTVKDEYVNLGADAKVVIQQGDNYASTSDGATITKNAVPMGGVSQLIINGSLRDNDLWILKPNANIDYEMGYLRWAHSWTNDYDDSKKRKASGFNSNAFDPYNIQISSAAYESKYFVTNATNADLDGEGGMDATYSGGSATLSLNNKPNNDNPETSVTPVSGRGHDSRTLDMSNATFMAVQDANGNMQLMPRFDHSVRVRNFGSLVTPTAEQSDATKLSETYTKLYRPMVYEYHIVDNEGRESLRYKSGGDLVPQMPDHFRSPLAKDFKYYYDHQAAYDTPVASTVEAWTAATDNFQQTVENEAAMLAFVKSSTTLGDYFFKIGSGETFTYKKVTVTNLAGSLMTDVADKTDISNKEITESFASVGLTGNDNDVYIRYTYDDEADGNRILKGKWFTMKLNEKDAKYNEGIKQGTDKPVSPAVVDGTAENKVWQWKFLETPQSEPDPYSVGLYNRSKSVGVKAIDCRFALLSHTSGGYALAETGLGTAENYDYTYRFLNGSGMTTSNEATNSVESGFLSTSCSFVGTNSQVQLLDDVEHTFNYKVYTNSGAFAISAEQSHTDLNNNDFAPELPEAARTPLLSVDDYRYYNKDNITFDVSGNITEADTLKKSLSYLYGLYDDEVYVHYLPYSESKTTYRVPNDIKQVAGHVARGDNSNDASLGLNGNLLYNIVWYDDQMMKNNSTGIDYTQCANLMKEDTPAPWQLQASDVYEWKLTGNDPYAIEIMSVGASDANTSYYVDGSGTLKTTPTTFMLLNYSNYDYGALQVTGDIKKLTGCGNTLTADAEIAPNRFIIFALATHKVIYHLVIARTATNVDNPAEGCYETIPFWNGSTVEDKKIPGSTQRDLSNTTYQLGETMTLNSVSVNYCVDAGHISLGDKLVVPDEFYRPNVQYQFFVEGVYTDDDCSRAIAYGSEGTHIALLDADYRGREVTKMGTEPGLLGKTVLINIVYTFDGDLDTNSGLDFVRSVADNKWYTFDTNNTTPWLAQYTNAWGLQVKEGRASHYTNDFLWTPLGDPYGFKMYNRYVVKNNNILSKVMTSTAINVEGRNVLLGEPGTTITEDEQSRSLTAGNEIYELIADEFTTPGFFKVHPMANITGTQYYLRVNDGDGYIKLSSSGYTEFTFGLDEKQLKPYYDRAGYVGGLTNDGKAAYEAAAGNLMTIQSVVYNDANIVKYQPGYYRLHSQPDIPNVSQRYASGYTHKTELTGGENDTAIPLHFYEVKGSGTTFALLRDGNNTLNSGYTKTAATRGDITIPAVESDPASIFYFPAAAPADPEPGGSPTIPTSTMSTQGLYVKGTPTVGMDKTGKVTMTDNSEHATIFTLMDIGGAVLLIHNGAVPTDRVYLNFDQTDADHIYDLKFYHECPTDHAKWCMQPANQLGLKIATHSGGDEGVYGTSYNYASFYAPFDILLPKDETKDGKDYVYQAFILDDQNSPWSPATADLHPKAIGRYSKDGARPHAYNTDALKDKFVPAGTPVLLAMWDQSNSVTVTLPTSAPSTPMTTGLSYSHGDVNVASCDNILSGEYLEQKLTAGNDVYVFGLPFSGTFNTAADYATSGNVEATLPSQDNSGLGFYLNANPNKEEGLSKADWTRNNWYVLANKVYYRAAGGGGAPHRSIQFIPVIFDNDEEIADNEQGQQRVGDGCIYDLMGRRVATQQEVQDGTWRTRLAPGIYILNGRKFKK